MNIGQKTLFSVNIQSGSRLIQNHYSRRMEKGPSDRDPLALAFRKACPALAADSVQSQGKIHDEISGGDAQSLDHLSLGRLWIGKT